MSTILVLNSSLSGDQSVSDQVVNATVAELQQRHPAARIVRRDLATHPLPHLTPGNVAGVRAVPSTAEEQAARKLSDELIDELREATAVVIGAPMYNFSIPATLRTWFDLVVRPNATFSYATGSPKGLIDSKPVIVVESRGGLYSEGSGTAADFQEPYLRFLLGFIGLDDVRFVRVEKIGFGPEVRRQSIEHAIASLPAVLETRTPLAA